MARFELSLSKNIEIGVSLPEIEAFNYTNFCFFKEGIKFIFKLYGIKGRNKYKLF